jgi:hypothetical protein
MGPAVAPFEAALSMVRIADPRIPVYSNVNNVVYQE